MRRSYPSLERLLNENPNIRAEDEVFIVVGRNIFRPYAVTQKDMEKASNEANARKGTC